MKDELIIMELVELGQGYKDYASAGRVISGVMDREGANPRTMHAFKSVNEQRAQFWQRLWALDTDEFCFAFDFSRWSSDSLAMWGKEDKSPWGTLQMTR